MPAVKVVKSITGFEVDSIHDSAEFGDQLERHLRKGHIVPLDGLEIPTKPVGADDMLAEIEALTKRIGELEKERDDWKHKAMQAATAHPHGEGPHKSKKSEKE